MATEAEPACDPIITPGLLSRLLAHPHLLTAVAAQLSSNVDRRAWRSACQALRDAVDAETATAAFDCKILAGLAETGALARHFPKLRELHHRGELQLDVLQRLLPCAWGQVTRINQHPTAYLGPGIDTRLRPPQLALLVRLCPRLEHIGCAAGVPAEAFAALQHLNHLTELLLNCEAGHAPYGTARTTCGSSGATLEDLPSLRWLTLQFFWSHGDGAYETMTQGLLVPCLGSVLTRLCFGNMRPGGLLPVAAMRGLGVLRHLDLGDEYDWSERWLQGLQLTTVTQLSFTEVHGGMHVHAVGPCMGIDGGLRLGTGSFCQQGLHATELLLGRVVWHQIRAFAGLFMGAHGDHVKHVQGACAYEVCMGIAERA